MTLTSACLLQLRTTLRQIERMLRALEDLQQTTLSKDPRLFAVMAEGPLEDLARLKEEVDSFLQELKPAG
ncbi:MAG: hypothetical protein DWQ45_08165 [Planctomycetota bacterium]|nr:MAG: hypothetical protein DWQ41_08465 [Planctomycetota bacterium]REK36595.1 MAG: hypothetical protein DWQ45_08165 [Planctomycetota bacterium]